MIGSGNPRPEVEPRSVSIDEILRWVDTGTLRIPAAFQQPFSWTPETMQELFESIDRGFPIGSLALWSTDTRLPTLATVGALSPPDPPATGTITYLLDGHQRLATLYSVLRLPSDYPREGDGWKWWIYCDLTQDTEDECSFVHVPPDREPAPYLLPLRSIIRTMDFLAFSQDLVMQVNPSSRARLVRRAEALVQHVKSYKLSTLRITGGATEEAFTIFRRLNRLGSPHADIDEEP